MNIFERTKAALDTLGIPYGMGTLLTATGVLPDYYLVYNMISGVPGQHADDEEKERNYSIQVTHYSKSGLADLADVDGAMHAAGFMKGAETPIPRDPTTGHYGLAVEYATQATQEPEGS